MTDELPPDAPPPAPPTWTGRMVFRQLAAVYVRKDSGADRGTAQRGPVGRVLAAAKFATGGGRVPRVHAAVPPGVTFADAERPAGPWGAAADALLTRYYRLKLESLQFCGPTNFGLAFWDGVESLAMTFPVIQWFARLQAAGGVPRADALTAAVRTVDDNFGFNVLLGRGRQSFALNLVRLRGELPKLVAWYGR